MRSGKNYALKIRIISLELNNILYAMSYVTNSANFEKQHTRAKIKRCARQRIAQNVMRVSQNIMKSKHDFILEEKQKKARCFQDYGEWENERNNVRKY